MTKFHRWSDIKGKGRPPGEIARLERESKEIDLSVVDSYVDDDEELSDFGLDNGAPTV